MMFVLFLRGCALAYRALDRSSDRVKRALVGLVIAVVAIVLAPSLDGTGFDAYADDALLAGVLVAAATAAARSAARHDVSAPLMAAAWTVVLIASASSDAVLGLVAVPAAIIGIAWSIRENAAHLPVPAVGARQEGLSRIASRVAMIGATLLGVVALLGFGLFVLYALACSDGCWS